MGVAANISALERPFSCATRVFHGLAILGLCTPVKFMAVYERTTGIRWELMIKTLTLGYIWRLVMLWWTGTGLGARTSTAFSLPPKPRPPHLGGQCSSCRSIQPKPGYGSLVWYQNPTPMGLHGVFQACNGGFAPCFGVIWRVGVQGVGVRAWEGLGRSRCK